MLSEPVNLLKPTCLKPARFFVGRFVITLNYWWLQVVRCTARAFVFHLLNQMTLSLVPPLRCAGVMDIQRRLTSSLRLRRLRNTNFGPWLCAFSIRLGPGKKAIGEWCFRDLYKRHWRARRWKCMVMALNSVVSAMCVILLQRYYGCCDRRNAWERYSTWVLMK